MNCIGNCSVKTSCGVDGNQLNICQLHGILDFAAEYAAYMLGSGASSLRVIRCTRRLTESFGAEVEMSTTSRHFIISCRCAASGDCCTRVVHVPELPVSFDRNSDLSTLSWDAHDEHLTLDELRRRFHEMTTKPHWNRWLVLLLISLANAAFCRLFGGDFIAMGFVFAATLVGFYLKQFMLSYDINRYLVFTASAFVASMIASISVNLDCTAATAIATSALYLVPGVPLINGIIDIVEGHVLVGISRLVNAMLIILCIAIGMSITLFLVKGSLL